MICRSLNNCPKSQKKIFFKVNLDSSIIIRKIFLQIFSELHNLYTNALVYVSAERAQAHHNTHPKGANYLDDDDGCHNNDDLRWMLLLSGGDLRISCDCCCFCCWANSSGFFGNQISIWRWWSQSFLCIWILIA